MNRVFFVAISLIIISLAGCASNIIVQFPPHLPTSNGSQLATIPPRNIQLNAVEDIRTLNLADGSREAAFGVSMGYVEFKPTASEIVQDIFIAELTNAGHKIVNQEQQVIINAQILQFKVGTIATPIYWDIIGNTQVDVEVLSLIGAKIKKSYTSTCQERTYIWPGEAIINIAMKSCIDDFANKFRNDEELALAIKNIAE